MKLHPWILIAAMSNTLAFGEAPALEKTTRGPEGRVAFEAAKGSSQKFEEFLIYQIHKSEFQLPISIPTQKNLTVVYFFADCAKTKAAVLDTGFQLNASNGSHGSGIYVVGPEAIEKMTEKKADRPFLKVQLATSAAIVDLTTSEFTHAFSAFVEQAKSRYLELLKQDAEIAKSPRKPQIPYGYRDVLSGEGLERLAMKLLPHTQRADVFIYHSAKTGGSGIVIKNPKIVENASP